MPNIELHPPHEISAFRKIALGTWRDAYDPSVYGTIEVVADAALDYIERYRVATGRRLTISHLMAKASAAALARMPDANAILRFNRPYRRKSIGVFFQVAMADDGDDKIDLSGATLYDVDQKDLATLVDEFEEKVHKVRTRADPALEKTRNAFRPIPFLLMNMLLRVITTLSHTFNLDLRWAGIPNDPFGSMMITNIGSLGLETAYVPLVPYARVPLLLALGEVTKRAVVEEDAVVVRQVLRIHATFDHRVLDGYHAAVMSKVIRAHLTEPDKHFGPPPIEPAPRAAQAAAEAALV